MDSASTRLHEGAADRHDRAALAHEHAAEFWADHGDAERAALQRELADHERRAAQLERRWATLVDRRPTGSA